MNLSKNNKRYIDIITLATIGNYIIELLPSGDGYLFSKHALKLCWDWVEGKIDDIGELYDCLDSSDEIDFVYYEEMAEDKDQQVIYRILFNILAYTTNEIATMKKMSTPQYLDMVNENFFDSLIIFVTEKYPYLKEVIDKVLKYCNNNILEVRNFSITQENIMKNIKN